MIDFQEIWDEGTLPIYTSLAGYDYRVVMYSKKLKKCWWFRDVKRFKNWKWRDGLTNIESGQGWNILYGIKPWGYFHLVWHNYHKNRGDRVNKCYMEIRYNRKRNIFGRKIVDEVRVIPPDVARYNELPEGSLIGKYNKTQKDGTRKFKHWFLMIKKEVK